MADAAHPDHHDSANAPLRRNVGVAVMALLASGGTLICCVLPAVMVALGAGAALAGLVTAVPQLVWLSEHKAGVFGLAGVMLAVAGPPATVPGRPGTRPHLRTAATDQRGAVGSGNGLHGGGCAVCIRAAGTGLAAMV